MMNEHLLDFTEIQYKRIKGLPDDSDVEQEGSSYQLFASDGLNRLTMEIHNLKVAAGGAFIEPDKYKFKYAYRILNRISKNPRGKKFISRADVIFETRDRYYRWEKLVCIDEYVLF